MTCLLTLSLSFSFFFSFGRKRRGRQMAGRQTGTEEKLAGRIQTRLTNQQPEKQTDRQPHRERKFTIFNAVKQADSKEKVNCFLRANRQSKEFGPRQFSHLYAAVQFLCETRVIVQLFAASCRIDL